MNIWNEFKPGMSLSEQQWGLNTSRKNEKGLPICLVFSQGGQGECKKVAEEAKTRITRDENINLEKKKKKLLRLARGIL